jgi:hypothetical protein
MGNGEKGSRKGSGVNMAKVHYIHVWKYHNEAPLYN